MNIELSVALGNIPVLTVDVFSIKESGAAILLKDKMSIDINKS